MPEKNVNLEANIPTPAVDPDQAPPEPDLDIDPTLLEEEPNMLNIDGKEVNYDDVVEVYKNMQNDIAWKAKNDTKSKEIASERRRLDEEKNEFNQQRQEFETLARGMAQQQPVQEQRQSANGLQLSQEELDDMTPQEKVIYLEMLENRKWREESQKQYETDRFNDDMRTRHQKMKSVYDDYDSQQIETQIIQGYDPFEAVYFANKFKSLINGEKDNILKVIPQTIFDEIKKDVRTQLIEDAKGKEKARKKLATTVDKGKGLTAIPSAPPKDWHDVNQRVVEKLREEGISLIK